MPVLDHAPRPTAAPSATPRSRVRGLSRGRPAGRAVVYPSGPVPVGISRAPHPIVARSSWRTVLAWLVLALVAVPALIVLRSAGSAAVPAATVVVQVRPGESLSELAGRVAPGAPTSAVVDRIEALNGLSDAAVRTGESLVVPIG